MPRTIHWDPPTTPFTAADVAALGVTRAALRTALARGRIAQLAHGVFVAREAISDDPAVQHVLRARAHQILRPAAIASHATAALAWQLPLDDPGQAAASPIRFILPQGTRSARSETAPGLMVALRRLPAEDRVRLPSGLVVTSPARTAVDVAAESDVPAALIVLDTAARTALIAEVGHRHVRSQGDGSRQLIRVRRELAAAAERAAPRSARTHVARAVDLVDPRRETPLESYSFGQMVLHGVPLPHVQARVRTPIGDLFPDFLWRDALVVGEADGDLKYRAAADLVQEKRRQETLEQLGFRVVRWDWREIHRTPGRTMARILAALEARRS